jgi:hypothetical protein
MVVRPSTYTTHLYRGFVKRERRTRSCPRRSYRPTAVVHASFTIDAEAATRRMIDRHLGGKRGPLHGSEALPERLTVGDSLCTLALGYPKKISAPWRHRARRVIAYARSRDRTCSIVLAWLIN